MKKLFFCICVCMIIVSEALPQSWMEFTTTDPQPPIVQLIDSDNQSVNFTVEVCGMFAQDIIEGEETYQRISIPSSGTNEVTGDPELPVIRKLIAIPECTGNTLDVVITGQTSFNYYYIYPIPDKQEVQNGDGSAYIEEVFAKNAATYSQNEYLPGITAEIGSTGYLRGQKYAEVLIYPVQFNPETNQLIVYTNYNLTLSFLNPSGSVNSNTGIFNNVASNTMLNYVSSGMTAAVNDNVEESGTVEWVTLTDPSQADDIVADYLIICADHFFEPGATDSDVWRMANHRASYNGFDVAILNADPIIWDLDFEYTNEDYMYEQKIRSCIRLVYEGSNAHHTYDGKLGYVLLIGDSEDQTNFGMPSSYDHDFGVEFPSDYYYSCLTNDGGEYDPVGDVFIGRFAVDNNLDGEVELYNFVEKTIFFETEYSFDPWRDNLINIYGYSPDNPVPIQTYFDLYEDYMNSLLMDYHTFNVIDATYGNDITQDIIDGFNSGGNYGLYRGHGGWNMWTNNTGSGGTTTISELQGGLTNSNKNPVIFSLACQTGWFDRISDCFGEALTTYSPDKGFVGFLGSARSVYLSTGTPINEPQFLQELIPYSIYNNYSFITGEFILQSKINSIEDEAIYYVFNYFGDPALNIMAHGFRITQNTTLPENTIISVPVQVEDAMIHVPTNGTITFKDNGSLIIKDGAVLHTYPNVQFIGNNQQQSLTIEGAITLNANCSFLAPDGFEWKGVVLNNDYKSYSFYATPSFTNCYLSGTCETLNIYNANFTNSGVKLSNANLNVQNSTFTNSAIQAVDGTTETNFVNITTTTVSEFNGESAILIDGYNDFSIDGCTIQSNYEDGIGIYNSGGIRGDHHIMNNIIMNNGLETSGAGVFIYNSYADLSGDQLIEGNYYGLVSFDNSNVMIRGYSGAEYTYETQQIKDNQRNQVFASQNSFPYELKWNAFIDEDN